MTELMNLEAITEFQNGCLIYSSLPPRLFGELCNTARAAHELQKFKKYVHERLDEAGVPVDPEAENNAKHGCRIEGRLNWIFEKLAKARQEERERCARLIEHHDLPTAEVIRAAGGLK